MNGKSPSILPLNRDSRSIALSKLAVHRYFQKLLNEMIDHYLAPLQAGDNNGRKAS